MIKLDPKVYIRFTVAVAVSELAGIIGSIFTVQAIPTWYAALPKPFLTPPSWVFGPVWLILYLFMGIAAALVWNKGLERRDVRIALCAFTFQLILNSIWSVIFFGYRDLGLAFLELVVLWISIVVTMQAFSKVSRPAFWLLVPYMLWVTFAGYLNYSIWQLSANPENIELVSTQDWRK